MKRKKQFIYFIFFGLLLSNACKNENPVSVSLEKSCLIEDKEGLLKIRSREISCFNENEVILTSYNARYINYSLDKKKLTLLFDSICFNVDSVINATFSVLDSVNYLPHTAKELKNEDKSLCVQLSNPFCYKDGYLFALDIKSYYLESYRKYYSKPQNRQDIIKSGLSSELRMIDSLMKINPNREETVDQLVFFIIQTDKNFHQQKLIPFYNRNMEEYFNPGSYMFSYNNIIYCPLTNSHFYPSDTVSLEGNEPNYFFKTYTLGGNGMKKSGLLIGKELINSYKYTTFMLLNNKVSYCVYKNELIASLGKELLNLSLNSVFKNQPVLKQNEIIEDFKIKDNYIVYIIQQHVKRKKRNPQLLKFGILDSLAGKVLKVQDINNNTIVYTKPLKRKGLYTLTPENKLYEYFKSNDSLFINKYSIKLEE